MEAAPTVISATDRKTRRSGNLVTRQTEHIRHAFSRRPFARVRSGIPTGTTPHFKLWMADLQIRRALQGTTLASLADRHEDPKLAASYGMLRVGGFRNVFELTQADARDLLRVKGIGPKRLEEVKADLAKHQVAVNW